MDTTTQPRMKTLAISYSDGCKQGDAETSVYCAKKVKQLRLNVPLVPPEPICASVCPWFHLNPSVPASAPNKLRPTVPKETFEGSRAKGKTTDYSVKLWHVAKTVCQETQRDTITNLTAEPVPSACQHPWWDLFTFVGLSSNWLCFVSTIWCFYQHVL